MVTASDALSMVALVAACTIPYSLSTLPLHHTTGLLLVGLVAAALLFVNVLDFEAEATEHEGQLQTWLATMGLRVFLRVRRPAAKRDASGNPILPPLEITVRGCCANTAQVKAYAEACQLGARSDDALPFLFLESASKQLSLFLLSHPRMPLSVGGGVHLGSSVSQHRPIKAGLLYDARVRLETATRPHRRGVEYSTVTAITESESGTLVYETSARFLSFGRGTKDASPPRRAPTSASPSPPYSEYVEVAALRASLRRRLSSSVSPGGRLRRLGEPLASPAARRRARSSLRTWRSSAVSPSRGLPRG